VCVCVCVVQCLWWAYVPLACVSAGRCGLMVAAADVAAQQQSGDIERCPLVPCLHHIQCTACLQSARCGWCALGGLNGRGVCMEGGYAGPVIEVGQCTDDTVLSRAMNKSMSGQQQNWVRSSTVCL